MSRALIVASLALGAQAQNDCNAGYKSKKVLKGLTCDYNFNAGVSCNTNCCEADTKTCGGAAFTCSGSTYKHSPDKAGETKLADAWAATATTATTQQADCCTAKAQCSSKAYTCPAGQTFKAVADLNAATCTSDLASCGKTGTACCKPDDTTCGGNTNVASDACDVGDLKGTDDAWKATKIVGDKTQAAARKASCCAALPTCASKLYSCPPGYKRDDKNANYAAHVCTAGSNGCKSATAWKYGANTLACCVLEKDTCGGQQAKNPAGFCSGNFYWSEAKASVKASAGDSDMMGKCCMAKATCKVGSCAAGQKKRANSDATLCSGDAASCKGATCCEADKLTCGGNAGSLACGADSYDPSVAVGSLPKANKPTQAAQDAWAAKPTTAKTLAADCCAKKASCGAGATGATTTPAASTTPAAAARLFAAHKTAAQQGTVLSNMTWLAVGGFIGATVLAMVQRIRASDSNSNTLVADGFDLE